MISNHLLLDTQAKVASSNHLLVDMQAKVSSLNHLLVDMQARTRCYTMIPNHRTPLRLVSTKTSSDSVIRLVSAPNHPRAGTPVNVLCYHSKRNHPFVRMVRLTANQ